MKLTSHFLAASLNPLLFADLFVKLHQYLEKNSDEDCVEFQNPLSVHLTLYYFPKEIDLQKMLAIKEMVEKLRKIKKLEINIKETRVFKKADQEYLYYLCPAENQELGKINDQFRMEFPNDLPENKYSFTPHVTLFRIIDAKVFSKHRAELNKIINKYLVNLSGDNAFVDFNLYAVNSEFSPQIQVILV